MSGAKGRKPNAGLLTGGFLALGLAKNKKKLID